MKKKEYVYFKFGINIFRYPSHEFSKKAVDIDLIENLVWKAKDKFIFEKNELSYGLGETINIKSLDNTDNLDDYINLPKQLSQEEMIEEITRLLLQREQKMNRGTIESNIIFGNSSCKTISSFARAYSVKKDGFRAHARVLPSKGPTTARKKAKIKLVSEVIK